MGGIAGALIAGLLLFLFYFARGAAREDSYVDTVTECPHCHQPIAMDESPCRWCEKEIESSADFQWYSAGEELRQTERGVFDVSASKARIAEQPRPVARMLISPEYSGASSTPGISEEADADLPIILGDFYGRSFLIDGRKRIAKALHEGRTNMKAVFLTGRETAAVRRG